MLKEDCLCHCVEIGTVCLLLRIEPQYIRSNSIASFEGIHFLEILNLTITRADVLVGHRRQTATHYG